MKSWTGLLGLASLASALTEPPSGALTVGTGQTYETVSAAVGGLSTSSTDEQVIFIQPGMYNETLTIPKLAGPLVVYGYSEADGDYKANQVTISGDKYKTGNDASSATVVVDTTVSFKMYNVNVANTFGTSKIAVALSAMGPNQGYYVCGFYGNHGTLQAQGPLTGTGAQLYANSYIEGTADFMYGMNGRVWFEKPEIGVRTTGLGIIGTSGRSTDDDGYYVINNGNIAAAEGQTVKTGSFYLARPWEPYARYIVQNTAMTDVINAAGWHEWEPPGPTDNVVFQEFNNTGAGSEGTRISWSSKADAAIDIETVLVDLTAAFIDTNYI